MLERRSDDGDRDAGAQLIALLVEHRNFDKLRELAAGHFAHGWALVALVNLLVQLDNQDGLHALAHDGHEYAIEQLASLLHRHADRDGLRELALTVNYSDTEWLAGLLHDLDGPDGTSDIRQRKSTPIPTAYRTSNLIPPRPFRARRDQNAPVMGTFNRPPAGTWNRPHTGTFSWPWTGSQIAVSGPCAGKEGVFDAKHRDHLSGRGIPDPQGVVMAGGGEPGSGISWLKPQPTGVDSSLNGLSRSLRFPTSKRPGGMPSSRSAATGLSARSRSSTVYAQLAPNRVDALRDLRWFG